MASFSYKQGNSFVHRIPAWLKILLIPTVSITFFNLPPFFSLGLFIFQTILAFLLHFSLREQLSDLRAVIYYAFFLIFTRIFAWLIGIIADGSGFSDFTWQNLMTLIFEKESLITLLKLFCVMQSASIMFRTSSSLQIREGLENIESAIHRFFKRIFFRRPRKSPEQTLSPIKAPENKISTPVAETVSLFICFIPQVAKIWEQSKRAWFARGGKNGIRLYLTLLPVLFSVGMKQAYNSARAISIRH